MVVAKEPREGGGSSELNPEQDKRLKDSSLITGLTPQVLLIYLNEFCCYSQVSMKKKWVGYNSYRHRKNKFKDFEITEMLKLAGNLECGMPQYRII